MIHARRNRVDYLGVIQDISNGFSRTETALRRHCAESHVSRIIRAYNAAQSGNISSIATMRRTHPSLAEWAEQFLPERTKRSPIEDAIAILRQKYREVESIKYVVNPVAYALYCTWKEVDEHGEKI